jgi:Farnesoic acid 0-methyl transferase
MLVTHNGSRMHGIFFKSVLSTSAFFPGSPCSGVQLEIPGIYIYNGVAISITQQVKWIFFSVKMANDFFIAFTTSEGSFIQGSMYEINIGGWKNQKTAIR